MWHAPSASGKSLDFPLAWSCKLEGAPWTCSPRCKWKRPLLTLYTSADADAWVRQTIWSGARIERASSSSKMQEVGKKWNLIPKLGRVAIHEAACVPSCLWIWMAIWRKDLELSELTVTAAWSLWLVLLPWICHIFSFADFEPNKPKQAKTHLTHQTCRL